MEWNRKMDFIIFAYFASYLRMVVQLRDIIVQLIDEAKEKQPRLILLSEIMYFFLFCAVIKECEYFLNKLCNSSTFYTDKNRNGKCFTHGLTIGNREQEQTTSLCKKTLCRPHFSNFVFRFYYGQHLCIVVRPLLGYTCRGNNNPRGMDIYTARLLSFQTFPREAPGSSIRLAQAGFYYTGRGQEVKCFCCGLTYNWTRDEKATEVHRRMAPNCLFISSPTTNDTLDFSEYCSAILTDMPLENQPIVNRIGHTSSHQLSPELRSSGNDLTREISLQSSSSIHGNTIKHPEFQSETDRRYSFDNSQSRNINHEILAKAGFFYTGDDVRCFHCGINLPDWDRVTYPPMVHLHLSPDCLFLRQNFDFRQTYPENHLPQPNFPDDVQATRISAMENKMKKLEAKLKKQKATKEFSLCKICYSRGFDVCLMPCGHTLCQECARKFDTCPFCKSKIKGFIKLYFC